MPNWAKRTLLHAEVSINGLDAKSSFECREIFLEQIRAQLSTQRTNKPTEWVKFSDVSNECYFSLAKDDTFHRNVIRASIKIMAPFYAVLFDYDDECKAWFAKDSQYKATTQAGLFLPPRFWNDPNMISLVVGLVRLVYLSYEYDENYFKQLDAVVSVEDYEKIAAGNKELATKKAIEVAKLYAELFSNNGYKTSLTPFSFVNIDKAVTLLETPNKFRSLFFTTTLSKPYWLTCYYDTMYKCHHFRTGGASFGAHNLISAAPLHHPIIYAIGSE